MPHSRSLSSMAHGLYELRVRDSQGNVRIFYYTKVHGALYIVHGLRKKTRVISDRDRALILKRIKEVGKKSRSNI
jgi:phage-related protein